MAALGLGAREGHGRAARLHAGDERERDEALVLLVKRLREAYEPYRDSGNTEWRKRWNPTRSVS